MAITVFASVADLQAGWRELSASEQSIAETLITRASAIVMDELRTAGTDTDEMDEVLAQNCKTVVCDMVRYSMVNAQSMSSSLFGETTDAAMWEASELEGGGLRLTKEHRKQLGLLTQTIGSIGYAHKPCRW